MTTITAPAPWDLPTGTTPDLDMAGTYYGVQISDIGDDGDVIALGHVGACRMVAAMRRHARVGYGNPAHYAGWTLEDLTDDIRHAWVVNVGGDRVEWELPLVDPTTPGAFPVTYWTA